MGHKIIAKMIEKRRAFGKECSCIARHPLRALGLAGKTVFFTVLSNSGFGRLVRANQPSCEFPALKIAAKEMTRFGFWWGIAQLGVAMSDAWSSDMLGFTAAYSGFPLIDCAVNMICDRQKKSGISKAKFKFKPCQSSFMFSQAISEAASNPIYFGIMSGIANLGGGKVGLWHGVMAVGMAILACIVFQSAAIMAFWKRLVSIDMPKGSPKDGMKSFFKSFRPFGIFFNKPHSLHKPETKNGLVWGMIGSMLSCYIWIDACIVFMAAMFSMGCQVAGTDFVGKFQSFSAKFAPKRIVGLLVRGMIQKRVPDFLENALLE